MKALREESVESFAMMLLAHSWHRMTLCPAWHTHLCGLAEVCRTAGCTRDEVTAFSILTHVAFDDRLHNFRLAFTAFIHSFLEQW